MSAMYDIIMQKPEQLLRSWYMLWFQIPIVPELKFAQ